MNKIKVLFLDIDGVVNCATTQQRHRGFIGIDPYMAFLVGKIKLDTNCEVVLSSSWRFTKDGVDEIKKQVCDIFGCTGSDESGFRGDEIRSWLSAHPEVKTYAILDDNSDFFADQNLFKTSWEKGITQEIAEQVTRHLLTS